MTQGALAGPTKGKYGQTGAVARGGIPDTTKPTTIPSYA